MFKQWKWYIYILLCKDKTYYTGCTWDINKRLNQHFSHLGSKYTKNHNAYKLVYLEEYFNLETALKREKQIKNWSQKKKQMLIKGKWVKQL